MRQGPDKIPMPNVDQLSAEEKERKAKEWMSAIEPTILDFTSNLMHAEAALPTETQQRLEPNMKEIGKAFADGWRGDTFEYMVVADGVSRSCTRLDEEINSELRHSYLIPFGHR